MDLQGGSRSPRAEEKDALRSRMRELRLGIPRGERLRMSRLIEERLFELSSIRDSDCVLVFSSFGAEVPTGAIVDRLAAAGRRVLLPYVEGREMEAAEVRAGEAPVSSSYGPKEPATRIPVRPGEVDAVVVPGLAFDRGGHRLGYGGGHYDRYLARLRVDAVRVGVAYHLQLVPEVPHEAGDELLDLVVTDRETIESRGRPRDSGP